MKRLIINADDFGLTQGVNRGIAEAHQQGVVTSATLLACGAEFVQAVALARELPRLAIGCHVDLIQFAPVSLPARIPTLARGARFRPGFARFARAALRGQLSSEEITTEVAAQFRRLQSAGISPSHFDTHKHTHIFPQVLRPLLKAAKMCGIAAVRNPFEARSLLKLSEVSGKPKLFSRYCAVRALRVMARKFRRLVEAEGLATTDGTVGIALTGFLSETRIRRLIQRMPEGTWELVTHPGYLDAGLPSLTTLTASRENELRLLTSPTTRDLLQEYGVDLISYRDLR